MTGSQKRAWVMVGFFAGTYAFNRAMDVWWGVSPDAGLNVGLSIFAALVARELWSDE